MKFHKSLLVGLCVVSLGAIALPITASAEVGVFLNIAPPPLRFEAVPEPRHGYVWAPGYWNARNHTHSWQRGHWEHERSGYRYNQPSWKQQDDDRWQLQRGNWSRGDRDGDGVPNSVDREPDNASRH